VQRLKAELGLNWYGDIQVYTKGLELEKPQVAVKAKRGLESELTVLKPKSHLKRQHRIDSG